MSRIDSICNGEYPPDLQDQYYMYDCDQSLDEKGLTIGGYEFLQILRNIFPTPPSLECIAMMDEDPSPYLAQ
jgi:hypothetical protein